MNRKHRGKQSAATSWKRWWITLASLSFLMILGICLCGKQGTGRDYSAFLEALAWRESSGRYEVENRYGYLGKYQMGELALQEAGFLDGDGNWTDMAADYNIASKEDFLRSEQGQEKAIRACHEKICVYIRHYGLEEYVGRRYCGVKVTLSGLLAACHLVGAGAMKTALQYNEPVFDGNRVPASEYMRLFAGYSITEVWEGNR